MPSFWDPANLLQITDGIRDRDGKISCIGITRKDARCRLTVLEPDLSEIRPLLRSMSAVKPELVTTDTLRRLARLCLCPEYHYHQAEEFVRHWSSVIKSATKNYENLLGSVEDTIVILTTELDSVRTELESRQTVQPSSTDLEKQLVEEKESAARWKRDSEQLRAEIESLKDLLQERDQRLETTKAALSEQRQANEALAEKIQKQSTENDNVQEENATLRAKLKSTEEQQAKFRMAQTENERLSREISNLKQDQEKSLNQVRIASEEARSLEQQLATERETRDAMAQQHQTQLDEQRNRGTTLHNRIADLEIIQAQLEASITSCWLHSFRAWASTFGGRLNRLFRLIGTRSSEEEAIALKTVV
ncbi:hypothetical protein ACJ41O_014896 [Fusarium nematophilum]